MRTRVDRSHDRSSATRRYVSLALSALALLALAGTALLGDGFTPLQQSPALGLLYCGLGILAAQHRPWGRVGLGPGAVVLPPLAFFLGPMAAVGSALGMSLAGSLETGARSRPAPRRLDDLTRHTLIAALVVAADHLLLDQSATLRTVVGLALWTGGLCGLLFLQQKLAGRRIVEPWRLLVAVLLEGAFLLVGVVLVVASTASGVELGIPLAAAIAGLSLEAAHQARARNRAEVRIRQFERLGRAGRRLVTSPSEVEGVAAPVYRECRQVLRFDWFELELLPRRPGEPATVWSAGPDGTLSEQAVEVPPYPPARPGIHRRVEWERFEHRLDAGSDEALAHLRLWCDPRRISPDSQTLLRQLLPQLGGMVYRAVLGEQARTDPLTGAALRRVLDRRLADAFGRSRHEGGSVAVVLCDLDFFKRVNDTYGHAAGDRALQAVARVLEQEIRESDLCARYGGEEFALVLEDLPGVQVLEIADRIRRAVEALEVPADDTQHGETPMALTLSAGIAVYPEVHCHKPEELVELADVALYEVKNLGRNGCLLYRGGGQYLDAHGRTIETREAGTVEAPHFFA